MAAILSQCSACNDPGSDDSPLKACPKCRLNRYCSQECQISHWQQHKKACAIHARYSPKRYVQGKSPALEVFLCNLLNSQAIDSSAYVSESCLTDALDVLVPDPFVRLRERKWLHDRTEQDIYKLLIDTYRLRATDDKEHAGLVQGDSVTSMAGFKRFLKRIECHQALLPHWWTQAKHDACCNFGAGDTYWNVDKAIGPDEIGTQYGRETSIYPQLRLFGEQVYADPSTGEWSGTLSQIEAKWRVRMEDSKPKDDWLSHMRG